MILQLSCWFSFLGLLSCWGNFQVMWDLIIWYVEYGPYEAFEMQLLPKIGKSTWWTTPSDPRWVESQWPMSLVCSKSSPDFWFLCLGSTLQGTNISPKNGILKMIFRFPRWDMLVPWRVCFFLLFGREPWVPSCSFQSLGTWQVPAQDWVGASGVSHKCSAPNLVVCLVA